MRIKSVSVHVTSEESIKNATMIGHFGLVATRKDTVKAGWTHCVYYTAYQNDAGSSKVQVTQKIIYT